MKKMMVAGLLALAVTAVSRQEASAWCKFCCSAGFNISYESTGHCFNWCCSWTPNPPPCYSSCYPGYGGYGGYAAYPAYPAYPYAYAPAAPAAAAAPAVAAPAAYTTQQVGYTFYGQGYAPNYWYGN
jgi:hypothetical protein